MNLERVKSIFTLFTGQENCEDYLPIISLAISQVENMLQDGTLSSESRLEMLAGAIANYRYVQILASRMETISAYNGEMLMANKNSNALECAEKIVLDYMEICSDLIGKRTILMNTGKDNIAYGRYNN